MFNYERTHDWLYAAACCLQKRRPDPHPASLKHKKPSYELSDSYLLFAHPDDNEKCLFEMAQAMRRNGPLTRNQIEVTK